jgi:hypothetical protein
MLLFWDVMLCHLIQVYEHIYCLQLQGWNVIQGNRAECVCCFVDYYSTLKMKEENASKMSAYVYQTVQCHITRGSTLHNICVWWVYVLIWTPSVSDVIILTCMLSVCFRGGDRSPLCRKPEPDGTLQSGHGVSWTDAHPAWCWWFWPLRWAKATGQI